MEDREESLRILRSNGRWGGAGADFNIIEFTDADTMQALSGLGETPEVLSYTSNNLIASGSTLWGSTDASVPRYCPPMGHIQATGTPPAHVAGWNVEPLRPPGDTVHTEEVQEVEPEYITYSRPSVSKMVIRNRPGPDTYEWEKRKKEIYNLYIDEGRSLPMVVIEMAKKGFYATSVINPLSLIPKNNTLTIYKSTGSLCTNENSRTGAGVKIKTSKITENLIGNLPYPSLTLASPFEGETALPQARWTKRAWFQAVHVAALSLSAARHTSA
jgi:Clr5 domain